MQKYHVLEGKLLGIKLKKIKDKWVINDFKVSEEEVEEVIKN